VTEELTQARRSRRRATRGRRFAVAVLALTTALAVGATACGDDDEPQPAGSESDAAFSEYIGLETEAAGDLAEENDLPWRVVREDGEDLPVTMDFVENRLNFAVEDGKVVDVTTG
jgi:hypothetical protein